jgi:hypothetical protein
MVSVNRIKSPGSWISMWIAAGFCLILTACGGNGGSSGSGNTGSAPPQTSYVLTVNSFGPSTGTAITVSPADINGAGNGTTSFTRTYAAGTTVVLTAPSSSGGNSFATWGGAASCSNTYSCAIRMSADTTIAVYYGITVAVTPNPAIATIGQTLQFSAGINGTTSTSVTWSVTASSGSPGTISSTGLYTTPYPAPAAVTVKATSTQDTTQSASVTVPLASPSPSNGPALTVDIGNQTRTISPDIYGMNASYNLSTATITGANVPVLRWGGDNTSRYNYQNGDTSTGSDKTFENEGSSATTMWPTGNFNDLVSTAGSMGIKTIGTAPLLGWVAKDATSCSFPISTYPGQYSVDSNRGCGDGENANQTYITGVPTVTGIAEPPPIAPAAGNATPAWALGTWSGGWVNSLIKNGKYVPGKSVVIWNLDNEPHNWDATHRDAHPKPSTYDEITNGGIGTALAIKTTDPTALISGPVIDGWISYYYSKLDVESGLSDTANCAQKWSNPVDRNAHGGVPLVEYYLQQMKAAEAIYGVRLLDYVDIHSYSAATYNGKSVGLTTTAGDTGEQQARMNSTRVLWDPTYTDPNFTQPNYFTDPNYTPSCTTPLQAPQIIPTLEGWVAKDYPGTKTSIDEYNFGGLSEINGAVTQADVLGIFGKYGLDLATQWANAVFTSQAPFNMAFTIYRNYDGNKSTFGDRELDASSVLAGGGEGQGQLAVYGALRSSDNAITIMVINKTYGDLTSTISLNNLATATVAQSFLYSNANLNAIVPQPNVAITRPAIGTTSTLSDTFPAQSVTLLVIAQ